MDKYNVNILKSLRDNERLCEEDDYLPVALTKLVEDGYVMWTVNGYRLTPIGKMFLRYGPLLSETLQRLREEDEKQRSST
jgi:predicted transcriptional regulator